MDPARFGGGATRRVRVRAWPLSPKTFLKSEFWAIPAGSLTPFRGPSRPAQGQGRLAAGAKHSSASALILFRFYLGYIPQNSFGSFHAGALDLSCTAFWYAGGQEGAWACSPRHAASTGHRWRLRASAARRGRPRSRPTPPLRWWWWGCAKITQKVDWWRKKSDEPRRWGRRSRRVRSVGGPREPALAALHRASRGPSHASASCLNKYKNINLI